MSLREFINKTIVRRAKDVRLKQLYKDKHITLDQIKVLYTNIVLDKERYLSNYLSNNFRHVKEYCFVWYVLWNFFKLFGN